MNRLQFGPLAMMEMAMNETPSTATELVNTDSAKTVSPNTWSSGSIYQRSDARPNHRLFIPAGYERNYAYPLLVYLHDAQQDAGQLHRFMPQISLQNYVGCAFSSPSQIRNQPAWQQRESVVHASLEGLSQTINNAQARLNINHKKIFLVGSGLGGCMAIRLAFMCQERIAGVISLNGELPTTGPWLSRLKVARNIPILLAHYRSSRSFSEQRLCENLILLHSAGFSVTMRQYPCDDVGCDQVYRDVNHWVMESVTSVASK
jgi:phospholipase/carboxylesterase